MKFFDVYETLVTVSGICSALKEAKSNMLEGCEEVKVTLATLTVSSQIIVLSQAETLVVGTQAGSATKCL